ncbi:hypothetical protein LTS18_011732, partial [Coniosporium uncinatum]
MTRHNLGEHLSWLLHEKPVIPLALPYAPPPDGIPTSSTTLSTGSFSEPVDAFLDQANIVPQSPVAHQQAPTASPQDNLDLPPDPRSVVSVGGVTEREPDMARLRAAPTSASKPRLLLQTVRPNNESSLSLATGPAKAIIAPQDQSRSSAVKPLSLAASYNKTTSRQAMEDWDIEAIDLTGGLNDYVPSSPAPANLQAGRKRKSDEYQADSGGTRDKAVKHEAASKSASELRPSQEFKAIDELVDEQQPDDPPPPYSTLAKHGTAHGASARSRNIARKNSEELYGPDDFDEEQTSVTEMRIRTETRTRKSLSRKPSDGPSVSALAAKRAVSPRDEKVSPSKKQQSEIHRKPRYIVDSEEDEDLAMAHELQGPSKSKGSYEPHNAQQPAASNAGQPPPEPIANLGHGKGNLENGSLKRLMGTPAGCFTITAGPPASQSLTEPTKDERQLLEEFAKWTDEDIKTYG